LTTFGSRLSVTFVEMKSRLTFYLINILGDYAVFMVLAGDFSSSLFSPFSAKGKLEISC